MTNKQNPATDTRWASKRQNKRPRNGANSVPSTNSTPIRVRGKIVGQVEGDMFVKRMRGSVHFLRKPPAIAFDIVSLHQAAQVGASSVRVIDIETGKNYQAPISLIFSQGFRVSRGFGEQLGLKIELFTIGDDPKGEKVNMGGPNNPPKPTAAPQQASIPSQRPGNERVRL